MRSHALLLLGKEVSHTLSFGQVSAVDVNLLMSYGEMKILATGVDLVYPFALIFIWVLLKCNLRTLRDICLKQAFTPSGSVPLTLQHAVRLNCSACI